ncbi:MAG: 2-oxoglutarate dehydrogenase E1 component [Planctomycetaceae bacterium]|nr:2-oxoglutarate dehydrogenase E1 component [Planctomycetaceae bacterium]
MALFTEDPETGSSGDDDFQNQFNSMSAGFVEALYADYLNDPNSVSNDWQRFFAKFGAHEWPQPQIGPSFPSHSVFNPPADASPAGGNGQAGGRHGIDMAVLQDRADQMVRAFRVRGHMVSQLDPLGLPRPPQPELEPEYYGFNDEHLEMSLSTRTIKGPKKRTLREIVDCMRNTYCRRIGVQFMHIDNYRVRQWLQDRMEGSENRLEMGRKEQLRILTKLTDAVIFEEFLQKSFLGAKSFSLEGAESLIPLLDMAIERSAEQGTQEIVLGMAHRGRLNVLANIMGKSPQQIFREFADVDPEMHLGRGDVKYHLGHSSDWITSTNRKVHLSLAFNPSHLEFVGPVVQGRLRAKQDKLSDSQHERGMAIVIHGDAAFAGQGVVQEMLNMSELGPYNIGGTLHIIINNQIGFTTPPEESRSCAYCTDVAKMLQSPLFHVNGEDPEAVAQVVQLAIDFRREFKRDVVIDMYCYRRRGHNEADEPTFTQPLWYKTIERTKNVREGYLEYLLKMDGISRVEADAIAARRREQLEKDLNVARSKEYKPRVAPWTGLWAGYVGGPESNAEELNTGVPRDRLASYLETLASVPADFNVHHKLQRFLEGRKEMAKGTKPLDWSACEALAFATLAVDGYKVRLTGQDCERGTFSHRHSVLHDYENGRHYMALANIMPSQAPVEIYNSPLSETGVLAFEYGYSLDWPQGLVMWEAQFGDFVNGAQVIIDQFITSGEDKWRRLSGIVMLLPHGFEGAGPEHSSARLERFLQQGAEDNIQVCNPTTPAQFFHLLRRQALRKWRKPLIVMTPKSLLRHPKVVSTFEDCEQGMFQRLIPDSNPNREKVERVLMCSGKIYYDLEAKRQELGREDVAILRLEQLYPLPTEILRAELARYSDNTPVLWVQEEPENMGAWRFLRVNLGEKIFGRLKFGGVYRHASGSPATGSASSHKLEQAELLAQAFGGR